MPLQHKAKSKIQIRLQSSLSFWKFIYNQLKKICQTCFQITECSNQTNCYKPGKQCVLNSSCTFFIPQKLNDLVFHDLLLHQQVENYGDSLNHRGTNLRE
ncbi:hypothetical protein COAQ111491_18590 [Comamonas aquatilis]